MAFERGAVVVLRGVGVALSRGSAHHDGSDGLVIELEDQVLFVPAGSDVHDQLRAPVEVENARALLEIVRASGADDREWSARITETERTIAEDELASQAAWLGALYAAERAGDAPLEAVLNRKALEAVVLSELAYVLGRTVRELSAELSGDAPSDAQ
ncbi:MAG: hypothetical protein R3F61_34230 [Myxococcota bacterium]